MAITLGVNIDHAIIAGIGVDIAETNRFSNLYQRYGERFAQRILTANEQRQWQARTLLSWYRVSHNQTA